MQLAIAMSIPKPGITTEDEGTMFDRSRLEVLDWEQKTCVSAVEYRSPPEHLGPGCSQRFTGGCAHGGKWYQTTATEIVIYDPAKNWEIEAVISHPSFNDLHGLAVTKEEIILVNTGLEMIQFLSHDGEIRNEVNVANVPTWERFDRDFDYRTLGTTKPHEVHVNHVFRLDGAWWATRCLLKDAVNLDDPDDRIDVGVGNPHDGIVRDGLVYFTTTNAHLVIADTATRTVVEVIDLNRLNPHGLKIGWCRGLEVHGKFAYVGFSRLRRSKWHGTFDAAKDIVWGRKRNSHIEQIDMHRKEIVDAHDYTDKGGSAIFTLADARTLKCE